jgi:hypothetical protein
MNVYKVSSKRFGVQQERLFINYRRAASFALNVGGVVTPYEQIAIMTAQKSRAGKTREIRVLLINRHTIEWFGLKGNGQLEIASKSPFAKGKISLTEETMSTAGYDSLGAFFIENVSFTSMKEFVDGISGKDISAQEVLELIMDIRDCRHKCACIIQKCFRGYTTRRSFKEIHELVSGIQKCFRGYIARKKRDASKRRDISVFRRDISVTRRDISYLCLKEPISVTRRDISVTRRDILVTRRVVSV